jgi:hypothetical protein
MAQEHDRAFARPTSDRVEDDDKIEVNSCIVCSSFDVEVVFPHCHVEGRRVAVPARVGLCSKCVQLIKAEAFEALAQRADAESWSDFDRSDLLDAARDLEQDLRP